GAKERKGWRTVDVGGLGWRSRQPACQTRWQTAATPPRPAGYGRSKEFVSSLHGATNNGPDKSRQSGLQASILDCSLQWTRFAVVVDRVPGESLDRHVQPRPDEDVDRYPRVGELALVTSVHDCRAASGRQMGDAGDVPGAGHLRVTRRRQ